LGALIKFCELNEVSTNYDNKYGEILFMVLELVSEVDVNKLSLRKAGKKYLLYDKAIGPYVKEIRKEIAESDGKKYKIKEETLREMLGYHLKNNSIIGIYQGLRYTLWKYNIVVYTRPRLSGKKNFYFRNRRKSEALPPCLQEQEACDTDQVQQDAR
jgi:hypothetical protein